MAARRRDYDPMATPDLTCRELVDLVTEYLEGALALAEHRRFERHLAFCAWCGTFVDQMRTTIAVTGSIRADDLAPDVQERLVAAFRTWRRG